MSTKQNEAQRLANRLSHDATTILRIDAEYAGVLLLRQDELLEQALTALEIYGAQAPDVHATITAIRAHLEAK